MNYSKIVHNFAIVVTSFSCYSYAYECLGSVVVFNTRRIFVNGLAGSIELVWIDDNMWESFFILSNIDKIKVTERILKELE